MPETQKKTFGAKTEHQILKSGASTFHAAAQKVANKSDFAECACIACSLQLALYVSWNPFKNCFSISSSAKRYYALKPKNFLILFQVFYSYTLR